MSLARSSSVFRAVGVRAGAPALPMRSTLAAGMVLCRRQQRYASTEAVTPAENISILNSQRERRPMSPHLAIYEKQLTSGLSIFNRITGSALSGLLYAGSIVYLLHPLYPALDSAHLLSLVADLPTWFKGSVKLALAGAFTFHSFNGIRHLMWDMGKGLTIKGVYATGYAVLAATGLSSIYLAFFV